MKTEKTAKTEITANAVQKDDLVSKERTAAEVMTVNKVLLDVQVLMAKMDNKAKPVHQV